MNTEANLIAHAILGAVEATITGNNAIAGAAAGAGGEAAAMFITHTLYPNKKPNQLTEAEKQNITFLSQLAGGLASGLVGDSTQAVALGGDIAKRAVENNYFDTILNNPQIDWFSKAEGENKLKEVNDIVTSHLKDEHPVAYAVMENGVAIATETGKVVLVAREVVLEVAPFLLTGGSAVSINPTLWGQLTKFAVKYPKLTETVVSGTVSTVYDIKNGEVSLEKTGMNYVIGGVNAGKTVTQQLAIDMTHSAITNINDKQKSDKDIAVELVAEPIGAIGATIADKSLSQIGAGSLTRQILSNVASQETKEKLKEKSNEIDNKIKQERK